MCHERYMPVLNNEMLVKWMYLWKSWERDGMSLVCLHLETSVHWNRWILFADTRSFWIAGLFDWSPDCILTRPGRRSVRRWSFWCRLTLGLTTVRGLGFNSGLCICADDNYGVVCLFGFLQVGSISRRGSTLKWEVSRSDTFEVCNQRHSEVIRQWRSSLSLPRLSMFK